MDISILAGELKRHKAHRAVKYISPKQIVRITRIGKWDDRDHHDPYYLTIGKPNYRERLKIKQFIAAGEPFPIKRIQFQHYPER